MGVLQLIRNYMDRDDQQYVLMAAAAAAAHAEKKARDEARRALIISTALNQNMSALDPDTQEDLRQLLRAESRRVQQENFDWKVGWWLAIILLGGLGLFFLLVLAAASGGHSYSSASSGVYSGQRQYTAEELAAMRAEAEEAEKKSHEGDVQLANGDIRHGQYILHPGGSWDNVPLPLAEVGTKVKCGTAEGVVTAQSVNFIRILWEKSHTIIDYTDEQLAEKLNTGKIVIVKDGHLNPVAAWPTPSAIDAQMRANNEKVFTRLGISASH